MPTPRYYVLIDTNIWVYNTHLLRTGLAAALLHTIARNEAKLALPEVVAREIARHAPRLADEARAEVLKQMAILGHFIGAIPPAIGLGSSAGIVDTRLSELERITIRFPFTWEHAKGALERVIAETPPNGPRNQQFKDTAIWMAALEAAKTAPVHFVTTDRAFFEDKTPSAGLAGPLLDDASASAHPIKAYEDLGTCLLALKADQTPFQITLFQEAAIAGLADTFSAFASDNGAILGPVTGLRGTAFGTEQPERVDLDLVLSRDCTLPATSDRGEVHGTLAIAFTAHGEVPSYALSNVQPKQLDVTNSDGERVIGSAYLYATLGVGMGGPMHARPLKYKFPL